MFHVKHSKDGDHHGEHLIRGHPRTILPMSASLQGFLGFRAGKELRPTDSNECDSRRVGRTIRGPELQGESFNYDCFYLGRDVVLAFPSGIGLSPDKSVELSPSFQPSMSGIPPPPKDEHLNPTVTPISKFNPDGVKQ